MEITGGAASAPPEPLTGQRNGGDLVVETLTALGATTVFGIPGQHALGLFDALSRSDLTFVSSRVENNSAFAADGFARATGEVGVLFLSTGPGALTSLAGLQEAYATGVPMIVIASQIPLEGLGARRKGMLHQLDDQKASAANVTKSQRLIQHASGIPSAIQDAWTEAVSSPQGPVWIEVPQNVLLDPVMVPAVEDALAEPFDNPPRIELVREALAWLNDSKRPAIVAGGGTRRGNAEEWLLSIAEKLGAPVVCSPGGNGAFPWNHELSLQSWVEDRHVTEVLEDADLLLVIGSSLGEVTSNYFTLEPRGRIIQIDAEPRVLESNRPALGIRADAGQALKALDEGLGTLDRNRTDGYDAGVLVADTLAKVQARLDSQDLAMERRFLADIREAAPDDMQTFWDMTISAYWAWSCWDARMGKFHSAQGAGGLGYGFPGAIGGAVGLGSQGKNPRVLAVSGDGSAMYSIAEL
ncbi:thiamine pyrophosphate-binding protein, partial [Arthrobacter sp. H41]|uniref:thiamine pyrophosphate-binding protein n=1 Tax=Arthrobacter sp. H41 TaxID=1312978 RepID=UPI0006764CDA